MIWLEKLNSGNWPNKSPEPTAVGACRFPMHRDSRRESAVAQLFSLGIFAFL
jgi:hypothetical protein